MVAIGIVAGCHDQFAPMQVYQLLRKGKTDAGALIASANAGYAMEAVKDLVEVYSEASAVWQSSTRMLSSPAAGIPMPVSCTENVAAWSLKDTIMVILPDIVSSRMLSRTIT